MQGGATPYMHAAAGARTRWRRSRQLTRRAGAAQPWQQLSDPHPQRMPAMDSQRLSAIAIECRFQSLRLDCLRLLCDCGVSSGDFSAIESCD